MPKNILGTSCTRPQNDDVCLLLAAGSTPIFLLFSIIFFYIYFGWDLVSALLLTAKRHRRRSAISYGNWPRHIYGTIKFLLAPLKINLCVCVRERATQPHRSAVLCLVCECD